MCACYRYRSVSKDHSDDDDFGDGVNCKDTPHNDDVATGTSSYHDDDRVNNVKLTETLRLLTESHRLLQASVLFVDLILELFKHIIVPEDVRLPKLNQTTVPHEVLTVTRTRSLAVAEVPRNVLC